MKQFIPLLLSVLSLSVPAQAQDITRGIPYKLAPAVQGQKVLDTDHLDTNMTETQLLRSDAVGNVVASSLTEQTDQIRSVMPLELPGQSALHIGPISAVAGGSTVTFEDRTRNLTFGTVVHETTPGSVGSAIYFKPSDTFTATTPPVTDAETFSGTTVQFMVQTTALGTALEYRNVKRAAGSAECPDANLTIRRNSHTDDVPVFDYIRDVMGGNGFMLNGGGSVTTTTIDLEREYLFLANENLYITIECDGTTPLNLLGQTIGGETIPQFSVWGRTGEIVTLEDGLGNPATDGQVLSSTTAGGRSWVDAGGTAATTTTYDSSDVTGLLSGTTNVKQALDRLDNTGVGAAPRTFSGSFFANYVEPGGNQNIWYGGRQTVTVVGERSQANGNYTFELPDISELTAMFDDQAARGLGEVFTLTVGYLGGNTSSIRRNSMTIRPPSVSALFDRNELPTTIAQGAEATFRIQRIGGSIGPWERVGVTQSVDPVATFGEVVLQNLGWNNQDGAILPSGAAVLKGYAFPVVGSTPNDGTLRQGILDAGVSSRTIYDGDYVIWTADAFTSWTNGDDWFVLSRNDMQRISTEAANFLSQVSEVDTRTDVAPVSMLGAESLVWLSENPLTAAPFLNPSQDQDNPRPGDNYPYVGGREDRNAQNQFQFGSNRFNNWMTVGITPQFIANHKEENIFVRFYDTDRNLLANLNLADDFTFVDDATFTNSTVRHYQRSTSVNYAFLDTIEIWLTQVTPHFRMNPTTVNVAANIPDATVTEPKLSPSVIEKLNRAIPPQGVSYDDISDRLSPYANVTTTSPAGDTLFASSDGTGPYPFAVSDFERVPVNNPVYVATEEIIFVATRQPGDFALKNLSLDTVVALVNASPDVEAVESFTDGDQTYFVYRVTNVSIGHRFEVERVTSEQVVAWANDLDNLHDDIDAINAKLTHAVLGLTDSVVHFLEDLAVTEETTPTVNATTYNNGLGNTSAQTVFYEPNPVAPGSGLKLSQPLSMLTGDQVRRKLLYIPDSTPSNQSSYVTAYDGTTSRDLISYVNGQYLVNVRVPAQPQSTVSSTVYPAQPTLIAGPGIWQNIQTVDFVNGVPVPLAAEIFFTRNLPTVSSPLTIDYRGHANGNVFGTGQTTLAGVGGPVDVSTTFTLSVGSETAQVEVLWRAAQRDIRVSATERTVLGLPTIDDVDVILSFTESRTIPATPATTRQVPIENLHNGFQVFAFRPGANGNLFVVGDRTEIDTNRTYETWFGAALGGHLTVANEQATFLNFEDFDPVARTVQNLEDHASLPQFGLFVTDYTRSTIVATDVTLEPDGFSAANLPTAATGLPVGSIYVDGNVLRVVQ